MKIETFIEYLSQQVPPNENSLNMYKGESMANIQRRENLRAYLSIMQEIKPTRLFIGEAPGKKWVFDFWRSFYGRAYGYDKQILCWS